MSEATPGIAISVGVTLKVRVGFRSVVVGQLQNAFEFLEMELKKGKARTLPCEYGFTLFFIRQILAWAWEGEKVETERFKLLDCTRSALHLDRSQRFAYHPTGPSQEPIYQSDNGNKLTPQSG